MTRTRGRAARARVRGTDCAFRTGREKNAAASRRRPRARAARPRAGPGRARDPPRPVPAEGRRVPVAVALDRMAAADDLAHELLVRGRACADAEEARRGAALVEEIEHARRDLGVGPVVERDRDFAAP